MGQLLVVVGSLIISLRRPQLELIPDPWYVPDKLRTGARDLGSVGPGYRSKPWCTGKQLPLGFNPTGQ